MGTNRMLYQTARNILLVEDSLVESELLRRTLTGSGYRVNQVHNGQEAMEAIHTAPPDLVMTDIRMPIMDGYELCRTIKRDPALAHIPVILLSVLSEPEDIIQAIDVRADSYTTKPYTEASLLWRLNSLLSSPPRSKHKPGDPLEVEYRDKVYRIDADPQQMLNLLLSVYENTMVQNRELMAVQAQLCLLNENLEEKVRQRTAALQESEARFRATFEQAAVGIAHVAPDGRWLRVNRRLCDLVGYTPEEMLAKSCKELTHPDDVHDSLAGMLQLLAGQSGSHRQQKRYLRKDGESLWVYETLALVRLANGNPDYFISVMEDISERKAAQDALIRLNAELEQRVAARTAELQVANAELEDFVSTVCHDLRAPLRALHGFSTILQQKYTGRLEGEADSYLNQIQKSALHMGELIEGLLTLARNTRGEMRHERIDLSVLARRILAELARAEPERKVRWDVEPDLVAWGDGRMLEVVLANLLDNAWKYTRDVVTPTIRVNWVRGERGPCFCVADIGSGFDIKNAGHLFQPFQRLHRQDEFPGLGIGLATCKRIIERHGGTIRASAKPGQGAVFCVYLPPGDD
jgi:PAS domain S-box-containing protein